MECKSRKFGVILLALLVLLTALMFTGSANAKTLYVDDDDGPGINFNTIQDAIDSANSDDSIFVLRNYISQDNIVNGEHIYHFYKVYGTEHDPFVIENVSLTKHNITNKGKITVVDSYNVTIRNCTVSNSSMGIYMENSKIYLAECNEIKENTKGIVLYNTENCIITNNTISENDDYGIYLDKSNHNLIFQNNFLNNTKQAYDPGMNRWNKLYPVGGNYWSDHGCAGNPSNSSYSIKPKGVDYHPFEDLNGWLIELVEEVELPV